MRVGTTVALDLQAIMPAPGLGSASLPSMERVPSGYIATAPLFLSALKMALSDLTSALLRATGMVSSLCSALPKSPL